MSSPQRKAERALERARETEEYDREQARLRARTLYQKIEDIRYFSDVKEVLHEMADRLDLNEHE